jgi:hypothetical protein
MTIENFQDPIAFGKQLDEAARRRRLGLPPIEEVKPRWSREQIAAGQARADAAAEERRKGPLPPDLRNKHVDDMSPVELDRAERALGLRRKNAIELQIAQHAWEARHRG